MTDNRMLTAVTTDIVSAHVSNNLVAIGDVPQLIRHVYNALAGIGVPAMELETALTPAVSIRASVKSDHLVCLEDGKRFKTLKRHLATDHGLNPSEYRTKWGLPADYPMVAASYAERRRALAKEIGLGRSPNAVIR